MGSAVLAFAPSMLFAQSDNQREAPEVRDLVLNGVHSVSTYDLQRSIATTKSDCKNILLLLFCAVSKSPTFVDKRYLDPVEFRRDVLRIRVFYWKRGFREATVDTAVVRVGEKAVKVVFDIHEGPPTVISTLRVEYDSALMRESQVKKLAILRSGDPLNLIQLDTMRLGFQLAMWDKGFGDAQVDTVIAVNDTAHVANVLLRVNPRWLTTVGTITVRGNEAISPRTIQNSIMVQPGRVFRYSDLAESQRNLYESNLFRMAMFSVPPRPDSVKDIDIEVRETKMREARVAGGFNTVEFVQTDGRFTNYNTFGGARRLDLSGAVGNLGASSLNGRGIFRQMESGLFLPDEFLQPTWQLSADVKQPAFLQKPENAVAIGAFAHRRAAPSVYIDRGYGGQAAFTRTLAPRAIAAASYRFEITRVEASDVYFCVNYGVCDNATVASLRLHQRLSPIGLSASIDRSDIPFSPTKGFIARVDAENASSVTISDYRYNRIYADASAYTHFRYRSRDPRAQVLAGHVRLGFVRALASTQTGIELLHPRKRFYAGGAHSVRGYDENQLGPRILSIPPELLVSDSARIDASPNAPLCDLGSIASIKLCDPNTGKLDARDFTPRPVGGTSLLEGSIEYRMPFSRKLEWAVFLDGGLVGSSSLQNLGDFKEIVHGSGAITPGVGFRYKSPVGPIRVDLGYNPRQREDLKVVTTARDSTGVEHLVELNTTRSYTNGGQARGFWSLFNQLVLHLSIGQAY